MADGRGRAVSRRAALATMAAGLGLGAAACGGFRLGSTRPVGDDVLLFTTWAGTAEEAAFQALADGFATPPACAWSCRWCRSARP